ncbi:type IV secretion system protein VirB10 [Vibrio alginolyticus]|uniref:type IV secretion system protein VirB10 n=1 Tax=Vibrio alginolyticus TaxID=663 RepID=UPI00211A74A6|nr:type IV secretion system protein VirB10 [Vibrio alginolyticus]MCQ9091010.1 type IV secretion system protein VirB10 [Vibrio alginolyticus]
MSDIESNEELNGEDVLNESTPDRKKIAGFIALCVLVVAIGGGAIWLKMSGKKEEEAPRTNTNISTTTSTASNGHSTSNSKVARTFEFKDDPVPDEAPPPEPEEDQAVTPPKEETPPPPPSAPKPAQPIKTKKTVMLDKSAASKSSNDKGSSSDGGLGLAPRPQQTSQTTSSINQFTQKQGATNTTLGAQLTGTKTNKALAGMLYNRDYLLAKGAYIDCVLNTSLNSTVAGMTKCTLTRNIYSDNGTTLLLERGSEVTGEYRGNITQGQTRLFVLWDRVKTPNGVVIDLVSPSTDSLGAGGVDGYVERHFWQRFGGAMMLSLVDDLAAYAANKGGESTENFENSSDAAQNMAAEALKHTIDIPPTFYKNQGERVGIVVARDLDFSTVYQLRAN